MLRPGDNVGEPGVDGDRLGRVAKKRLCGCGSKRCHPWDRFWMVWVDFSVYQEGFLGTCLIRNQFGSTVSDFKFQACILNSKHHFHHFWPEKGSARAKDPKGRKRYFFGMKPNALELLVHF